ncbi:MAG: threonine synthase [Archaeoglobaceae archaeon]
MSYLLHLECSKCGKKYEANKVQTVCRDCNSPLLAVYDLEGVKEVFKKSEIKRREPNMWRYIELLPIQNRKNIVTLGEGFTPVHKITVEGFGEVYLKDDGIIPTGTFKARGLSIAVSRAKELGLKKLAIPSAGNAASALATYCAKAGLEAYVIMPQDAPLSCKIESYMAGAHVYVVRGLISDAAKVVEQCTKKFGWFDVSTMKEPYRLEGKKTMGLEIAEQLNWELPDAILYPTGGGTGIIGMWKAFKELQELDLINSELPKMIVVQAEGCAPIVRAFKEGKKVSEHWKDANTIAAGIRVPKPFADFMILNIIYESKGFAISVSDNEILNASRELAQKGIFACPEGAATLAALKKLFEEGEISSGDRVLLYNTGTGLKYIDVFSENFKMDFPIVTSAEDLEKLGGI